MKAVHALLVDVVVLVNGLIGKLLAGRGMLRRCLGCSVLSIPAWVSGDAKGCLVTALVLPLMSYSFFAVLAEALREVGEGERAWLRACSVVIASLSKLSVTFLSRQLAHDSYTSRKSFSRTGFNLGNNTTAVGGSF